MGVKGREETAALIQIRGDGGKGKAWSEMVGQVNSPCDWMECERRRKRDSKRIPQLEGRQETARILFGSCLA